MPLPTVANPALDSSLGAFSEKYVVPLWTNHFKSCEYAVQLGAETHLLVWCLIYRFEPELLKLGLQGEETPEH